MLKKIFGLRATSTAPAPDASSAKELQALDAQLLVGFLCEAKSIISLSEQEAKIAARYMRARQYATGQVIIKEGDKTNTNYMLWILDGETTFEASAAHESGPIIVTVLGPGTALGEMGLMDGAARSLTCTASAPTRCAVLTKQMLQTMCSNHPEVAAKLMSIICIGISARLRDLTDKFKRYVRLNSAMNEELRESMPMQQVR
jgi:CRP/FNR family transcriptional regulator, cyclic AMP receptor protein